MLSLLQLQDLLLIRSPGGVHAPCLSSGSVCPRPASREKGCKGSSYKIAFYMEITERGLHVSPPLLCAGGTAL